MSEANAFAQCQAAYQTTDPGRTILIQHNIADYDQTRAVEVIGAFNRFLIDAVTRYEGNLETISICDRQTTDMLHLIELHSDMNASEGYRAYRKLAAIRRQRRVCKNENELLAAAYAFIKQNPHFAGDLSGVLGKTRAAKASIEKKVYCARTDII